MGALRVGFLKLVIVSYSGDTGICYVETEKDRVGELRVIYEMGPADFYTAHNRFIRVTGTLGHSRFPKLR